MGRADRSIVMGMAGLWNLRRTSSWRQNLLVGLVLVGRTELLKINMSDMETKLLKLARERVDEDISGRTVVPCGRRSSSRQSACVSWKCLLGALLHRDLIVWRGAVLYLNQSLFRFYHIAHDSGRECTFCTRDTWLVPVHSFGVLRRGGIITVWRARMRCNNDTISNVCDVGELLEDRYEQGGTEVQCGIMTESGVYQRVGGAHLLAAKRLGKSAAYQNAKTWSPVAFGGFFPPKRLKLH